MKRFAALLLALSVTLALAAPGASAASESAKLETIQALGIMQGDSKGNMNLYSSVTRAEFITMMTAASPYKDTAGGSVGSLFKDVKSGHWAGSYIKVAVEQGWMTGYSDGTFRPDRTITLEEGCTALLRLLGYDPGSFTGSYPAAQLSKAGAVGLLDGLSAAQGRTLTRNDCVGLFYNLLVCRNSAGAVYGTSLGYTVSNGEVDYSAMVSADTKGPYVAEANGALALPFSASSATVYRNNSLSAADAVKKYDVYYYNENMRTVWVYDGKATGTLTAVSPDRTSPASATVAGISYKTESSQASYKLSSQGEFQLGDLVTLLLGKDGGIVDVVSALDQETAYYGVVVSTRKGSSSSTTSTGSASAQSETQVACSDGELRTFYHSGGTAVGRLVAVTVTENGAKVSSMQRKRLSGVVNSSGTKVGTYRFAGEAEILDTDSGGGYVRIYPSRLAGARLEEDDVYFYTLNSAGEIDRLILQEATGDTYAYVYVTGTSSQGGDFSTGAVSSGSLNYIQNGQSHTYSGSAAYASITGGAVFLYEDGEVKNVKRLERVALDRLGDLTAAGGNKTYQLAENIQVLLVGSEPGRTYYAAELSDINASEYTLTGWYDSLDCSAGGRIRIILAEPK